MIIINSPVRDFTYDWDCKEYTIKAMAGWKFIEFTRGTEGKFIRVWKWYIKIGG